MKIVYCIDSIAGIGGIQRVTVSKANALSSVPGYTVWIVVADNSGESCFPLSGSVHFMDLAVNYYEDDWKSKLYVLKGIIYKRRIHRKRLSTALKTIQPDVVVSVGQSEKFFLPFIRGRWKTVREFHFTRNYRQMQAHSAFYRLLAWLGDQADSLVLRKYDRIVVLTQEDKDSHWRSSDKVIVIPNPIELPPEEKLSDTRRLRVISVGRLTYQKNYASLIRSYAEVAGRFPDWELDIFGDGEEMASLSRLVADLHCQDRVFLRGAIKDVWPELSQSSLFVMSSRFEGFSMALLEAMSCGLPVVSYACPCGPKDIIREGIDGFLVPPGDESMLADRLFRLIEDDDLRKRMSLAARERVNDFLLEKVIKMWMNLFDRL